MWDDTSSPDFAPISALSSNDNCVTVWVQPGAKPGNPLQVWMEPNTAYVKIENHGVTVDSTDSLQLNKFKVERKWVHPENTIVVEGGMVPGASPKRYRIEVLDAPLYVGTRLRELMTEAGVALKGKVVTGRTPDRCRILVEHLSPPLTLVVFNTNKISDNLSAEMLLKTLGAELKGVPGSAEKGAAVVRQFLAEVGVDSNCYEMVDGSGVSRYNVVTPELMVKLLRRMYGDLRVQAEFQASLPIAGVDGTLEKRMLGTPAERKLHAKTGTLRGVSTLSGYTQTADGEVLAFSMMMEHFLVRASRIRQVQDRIGAVLSGFSRRAGKALKGL
jgi:PBP4 family serine-type D-alanyl-D-alanine carboxypeptidase